MISNLFISVIVSILSYNMNQLQGAIFSPRFFARRIKSSAKSFRLAAIFTASFREKKLPSHPRHCLLTKFIPMYLGSHSPARQTAEQTVGKDLPGRGWLEDGWRGFWKLCCAANSPVSSRISRILHWRCRLPGRSRRLLSTYYKPPFGSLSLSLSLWRYVKYLTEFQRGISNGTNDR